MQKWIFVRPTVTGTTNLPPIKSQRNKITDIVSEAINTDLQQARTVSISNKYISARVSLDDCSNPDYELNDYYILISALGGWEQIHMTLDGNFSNCGTAWLPLRRGRVPVLGLQPISWQPYDSSNSTKLCAAATDISAFTLLED